MATGCKKDHVAAVVTAATWSKAVKRLRLQRCLERDFDAGQCG